MTDLKEFTGNKVTVTKIVKYDELEAYHEVIFSDYKSVHRVDLAAVGTIQG